MEEKLIKVVSGVSRRQDCLMRVLLFDRAEGELSIEFIEKKKEFILSGYPIAIAEP